MEVRTAAAVLRSKVRGLRRNVPPMLTARPNAANATILVVDDSPGMRRYLRLLLELDRYQVETARDGNEALRRLEEGCVPAVVLLDLQMPGLDGLRTLQCMRKQYPDLKVIICSGEDDPEKFQLASALGAQAHLIKPVQHLYLSAAVERCLALDGNPIDGQGASVISLPSPVTGIE